MAREESKSKKKIVIELTDWQSEILDKIMESLKKENQGIEITRELILDKLCVEYIGNEGGKLIKQG